MKASNTWPCLYFFNGAQSECLPTCWRIGIVDARFQIELEIGGNLDIDTNRNQESFKYHWQPIEFLANLGAASMCAGPIIQFYSIYIAVFSRTKFLFVRILNIKDHLV